MKKDSKKIGLNDELKKRMTDRHLHRGLKMSSIIMVVSMITVLFPIVPLGHASDTYLSVPSDETLQASAAGSAKVVQLRYSPESEMNAEVDPLINDTYIISEHSNRDGVAVEMLDAAAFAPKDEVVYALKAMMVYSSPASDAEVVETIQYADMVKRIGIGSAWSHIAFETEEGQVTGYVLSENLTSEALATPTPAPEPTATPTPEITPKKEKTPTPTPEKKEDVKTTPKPKATPTPTPAPKVTEKEMSGTFYSNGDVNVRSGPSTDDAIVRKLVRDEAIKVVAKTGNGWYKLSDGGYVRSDLVRSELETEKPEQKDEPTSPTTTRPNSKVDEPSEPSAPATPTPAPVKRSIPDPGSCDLLTYARAFIGIPYVYTGASLQGLDCSGFVMYVYARYYGISLPHQSASIAKMGTDVTNQDLKAGDVICHDYDGDGRVDHVSLYCGSGVVIHASTSRGGIVEDYVPMSCVVTVRRFV